MSPCVLVGGACRALGARRAHGDGVQQPAAGGDVAERPDDLGRQRVVVEQATRHGAGRVRGGGGGREVGARWGSVVAGHGDRDADPDGGGSDDTGQRPPPVEVPAMSGRRRGAAPGAAGTSAGRRRGGGCQRPSGRRVGPAWRTSARATGVAAAQGRSERGRCTGRGRRRRGSQPAPRTRGAPARPGRRRRRPCARRRCRRWRVDLAATVAAALRARAAPGRASRTDPRRALASSLIRHSDRGGAAATQQRARIEPHRQPLQR